MNKLFGITIILTETFLYALLSPLLKKANLNFQPFTVMTFSMLSLFIFSLIMSICFENLLALNMQKDSKTILFLFIIGLINGVAFWLGIKAYKFMPLSQLSLFGLLSPIFITILAYFILGEKITYKIFISLGIMAIGLIYSLI